jgi:integron integrase
MPFANRLPLRSTRLLDQLRERIRYCHYSLRTEQAYVFWVRRFIRFHGMRHPREMGGLEVESFLTDLATRKHVSPSTHKQALSAILYLYREVLGIELPWMGAIGRPQSRRRLPVVLSRNEVARLLQHLPGGDHLIASLLYGSGLRLLECLQLRVKDVDFDRRVIVVRDGKGGKDRVVMLPAPLLSRLREQAEHARAVWAGDRRTQVAGVWLPDALCRKYRRAPERGRGSGSFRRRRCRSILEPASGGVTISTNRPSVERWPVRRGRLASSRRSPRTRFGIRSRLTCSTAGSTSGAFRNCSGTAT